jgi:hypothetical protein
MKQTIAVCVAVLALLIVPCNAQNRLGGGTDGQGGPQAGSLYRIYDTSQVKPIYRQRYRFIRRIPPSYYSTQGQRTYR